MTARHPLPDGSTAVVDPATPGCCLVSRAIDGRTVWGQAFAWPRHDNRGRPDPSAPARWLTGLLDDMTADPSAFTRWSLEGGRHTPLPSVSTFPQGPPGPPST